MERLTEWRDGHGTLLHGDGYTKLAQYEDTGLEPEEIQDAIGWMSPVCVGCDGKKDGYRTYDCGFPDNYEKCLKRSKRLSEISDAEQKGCLVILPFPIGTEIWSAAPFTDGRAREGVVTVLEIAERGCYAFWASFSPEAVSAEFLVGDEGKTFFLTKEDAEKA